MGRQLEILSATTNRDIKSAFEAAMEKRADALLIVVDPLFTNRPVQLAILAALTRCRRSMRFVNLQRPAG